MKKNYFIRNLKFLAFFMLLMTELSFAQSDFYSCIPSDNATSGNARAPHGRFRYERGVVLIKPTEMTASGLVNGNVINSIAFNYLAAQNIPTNGTMTLYLQNTTNTTNTKALTWATAITGMTTVSTGAVVIPNTAGNVVFDFSGGTPFTYTGGGVYVAFDYQNAANPLPTSFVTVDCNSAGLVNGFIGAQSDTAAQTALTASSFRPVILLGKSVPCAQPINMNFNNPTLNSVDLSWTVNGGSGVDIEYGPYGFTQGAGTTVSPTTSPYTLSSLTPSTVYDFYIRKNCGSGVYSAWTGPYAIHTSFQPTTPTYNTGFEQEDFPFIGWTALPNTTANDWFINVGGTGSPLVQQGVASAIAITPATAAANEDLFSRGIDLVAGSNVTVTFYDRNYVSTTAPISTNTASYSLTVGADLTAASQTTSLYSASGLNTTTFTQRTATFSPATTGTYYFRFKNSSPANASGTHAIIIDNFTVTQVLGINEFNDNSISVYPNPTKDILNISNSNQSFINAIEVTDINGRLVKSQKFSNVNDIQVNISDLSKGVYMLKAVSDKGTVIKKIVKE